MKLIRNLSFYLLLFTSLLVLVGCGGGTEPPQGPENVCAVPLELPGGQFTLTWEEPDNWGSGNGHCYRVEFFDGENWSYLDTVTETSHTYELPLDVNSMDNRFSVRAETSDGHSDWVTTNSFDVINPGLDEEEYVGIEPGDQELPAEAGEFTLVARVSGYDVVSWSTDVPWLNLPAESEPDQELVVQVDENDDETERMGIITARAGDELMAEITVTQAGAEATVILTVTPGRVNIDLPWKTSFDATASVSGNGGSGITWSSNANWITVPRSGIAVRINIAENDTNMSRTGTVTVSTDAGLRKTLTVIQAGRREPDAPTGLSCVPGFAGEYTLAWNVPTEWGTGEERQYLVELYDGSSWLELGEVAETEYSFTIPEYVDLAEAEVRVRAETSHGHSSYVNLESLVEVEAGNGEDDEDNEYWTFEPNFMNDELTLSVQHAYYEDGSLIVEVWIANGLDVTVSDLDSATLRVMNDAGEIAQGDFGALEGEVILPGEAAEWRFEFPLQETEAELRHGITTEFSVDYSVEE